MRWNYWKSISDHAIKETWNKTPGHSGIWECYLREKAPQILPQIRAYQNSVPDLRNPNIHIKNTVSSYSWIGTWVALGLGSHLLLKHAIHKNNSDVPSPQSIRDLSRWVLRLYKQLPFCAHSCENLVLNIYYYFLHLFLLCRLIAEVLSEVLSPPRVIVEPQLEVLHGTENNIPGLIINKGLAPRFCSWHPMSSEIALGVLSNQ